jgi:predicted RNA binding protein YcfA (HicA-like mRNA interferase family)
MKFTLSSREILQILNNDDWVIKNQRGSHILINTSNKNGKIYSPSS